VATLWRAVVDTGALNSWSLACMGAGRPCGVMVRGGGHGRDWDKDVASGAGAGAIGMVCGVHDVMVGQCEMGSLGLWWVECSDEGSSASFYVPGPWAICGRTPTYGRIGEKGKIKRNREQVRPG
jgi:hypothetical protein